MKIIFLDFGGTTHPWGSKNHFNSDCIDLLNTLVSNTQSNIVVTSLWLEQYTLLEISHMLINSGFKGLVVGGLKNESSEGVVKCLSRGMLIKEYLAHRVEVISYVILDDYCEDWQLHEDNYVEVNADYGITEEDIIKAENILNG